MNLLTTETSDRHTNATPAIDVTALVKRYGDTLALDAFDLTVPYGTVCGLLGPNGAGKTTAVRILSTLLQPDSGRAKVAGLDVVTHPVQVRYRIGLTGQLPAVEDRLTGRENLELFARFYRFSRTAARNRAAELLERFDLVEAADRPPRDYSGGMRRRLDLAISFVMAPPVLFLDEPTTGMDPGHRQEVWNAMRALVAEGTTVVLTTHYLDEADQLADALTVVDHGRVIARGTPDDLKSAIGGDRVDVIVDEADIAYVSELLTRSTGTIPQVTPTARRVTVTANDRVGTLAQVARTLDDDGVAVHDVSLRRPTLDDVFAHFTRNIPDSRS
ncbi:ATP-binding cassette domain-containing protein [Actinobacteria bacterium YIM 96077]|uniref:Daunorubicin/doxorubicin resistance ABC transporter ATP-binding protein DrrA n=1 Tax=Phytoactinopolyspora halophila TaxID=1981511 RepID=A0A329QYC8_9ACTN|nr:ATP-binding cassette domain-containing protein [Phytoactinopolyspora halophila]AYY12884.1 ATP-binding cassette domain-containing protein [Actinobacteria bacterium YIM 96077]RAW16322.1 daunorubicin/doxorubicin resistance ABC transporter ATP-binding protein DrrA [Phytoactinopolyspora halophila]